MRWAELIKAMRSVKINLINHFFLIVQGYLSLKYHLNDFSSMSCSILYYITIITSLMATQTINSKVTNSIVLKIAGLLELQKTSELVPIFLSLYLKTAVSKHIPQRWNEVEKIKMSYSFTHLLQELHELFYPVLKWYFTINNLVLLHLSVWARWPILLPVQGN